MHDEFDFYYLQCLVSRNMKWYKNIHCLQMFWLKLWARGDSNSTLEVTQAHSFNQYLETQCLCKLY